ncbi:Hypothetical predicted protein, partial [Mytilus galloprovincialis]
CKNIHMYSESLLQGYNFKYLHNMTQRVNEKYVKYVSMYILYKAELKLPYLIPGFTNGNRPDLVSES